MENFTLNLSDTNRCTSKDINLYNISINVYNKDLFIDTDLKINYGFKYGLVGKNGICKTTLLKHIAHRILPIHNDLDILYVEQEIEPSSEISVFETVISANKERSELIKLMDNDNDTDIEMYQELQERFIQIGGDRDESIVKRILIGMGFTKDDLDKPTAEFSGGWRMRISLARALYMKPTLLILDEPTNHLDLKAVIWFTEYLKEWKTTLLVVSHNKNFLNEVCTHIINIEDKKLVYYSGSYDKFKQMYINNYETQLKNWIKSKKKTKRPEKPYEVKINFKETKLLNSPILVANDLTFYFDPRYILFENLNLNIDMNSRITIVGDNGVGKSTLINLLVGNLKPVNGSIYRNHHLRIGYYNQHFTDSLPLDQTSIEYITQLSKIDSEQEVRKLLGTIGLEGSMHKIPIKHLSGGQKARVAFISLFVSNPHLLFLDEPTNHLDMETIEALISAINSYNGGVIIISHDVELITKTNCDIYICQNKTLNRYENSYQSYKMEILSTL